MRASSNARIIDSSRTEDRLAGSRWGTCVVSRRSRWFTSSAARTRPSDTAGRPRHARLRMRGSPLDEILVLGEDRVDHLVEHVFGGFAEKVRVRVQRLVVLAIETCPMLHKLLAAGARLD